VALPKVNTRPRRASVKPCAAADRSAERTQKLRRVDWDVRFAIGLILLVVVLNAGLTLLLGGSGSLPTPRSAVKPPKETVTVTPGAGVVPSPKRPTEVYISREDKRLLLRQLNARPKAWKNEEDSTPTASEERDAQTGTFRTVREKERNALSIIGTPPRTTPQQEP
jgi:hypothetical protein